MKISIVVATDENNAIGAQGGLLWHLPKDMQQFKQITMGHHVLMGRKTYDSIPPKFKPLPGRENIIVSHQKYFNAVGCHAVLSVQQGIDWAAANGEQELMIIGGGEIYKQCFGLTDKIYLTKVHHSFAGADAFFPAINETEWKLICTETHLPDEKHQYGFEFLVLERSPGLST